MKRFQSVLCTLVLALSLSSTVFAAGGIIHGSNASGILVSDVKANGILISDAFGWGDITGIFVNSFGYILAS